MRNELNLEEWDFVKRSLEFVLRNYISLQGMSDMQTEIKEVRDLIDKVCLIINRIEMENRPS